MTPVDEIATQVSSIQTAVNGSVSAVDRVSTTIKQINEVSTGIAAAVEEQSAATQEIARTTATVSEDSRIVLDSVAGLTQSSAQSGGKSISILWSAEDLEGSIEMFSSELGEFLEEARSV